MFELQYTLQITEHREFCTQGGILFTQPRLVFLQLGHGAG